MRQMIADGVKVQMCVTSPPYWDLRDYGVAGQLGLEPTIAEYVANMVEVFGLVRELLRDDGVLFLNLGDSYHNGDKGGYAKDRVTATDSMQRSNLGANFIGAPNRNPQSGLKPKDLCGIPWRVAFALQAAGWYLRQDIIWAKPNPMPESVTDRCTKSHEYLFLLAKSERYYMDMAAIAEQSCGEARGGGLKAAGAGHKNLYKCGAIAYETRNKRSVWTVATAPYADAHFATFPPALIEPCILAGSRSGDIVLDPFIGSGTTGQVAQALGRQWIGCELNPAYGALQDARTAQMGMVL
jgi:DNA modification methylase